MKRPSRWLSALPGLAVSLAAAACLLLPGFRAPGQRGGLRIADGFRPGRWDARFVVARGPASLRLPEEGARVTLLLSGPARLRVRGDAAERALALGTQPEAIELVLPAGGALLLEPDATIRLHELRVERAGPPRFRRVAAVTLAAAAGLALAFRIPGAAAATFGGLLALVAAFVSLRGTLAGVLAAVAFDRLLPSALVAALLASFLLLRLAPRGRAAAAPTGRRLPGAFGALLFASCLLQLALYEQPLPAGDPAAYYEIGGRFKDALVAVRSPDDFADAVQTLRPYGGLALTGLVYGLLRALRDQTSTLYLAHALAFGGCGFFLVRAAERLGGARLAAVTGLLALSYGTFPVLAGIVQPEPFLLLAWTFSLDALLAATEARDARRAAWAGLAFALGLALHPQGIWFLLAALALVLLPFARTLRAPARHALVRGFALGLLPVVLLTAAGENYARPVSPVLDERHGFWAYTAGLPLGFWLFLETDGWQGPMRLDETRYAGALRAAEESGAVSSAFDRLAFTLRFVAENAPTSLRTVLRNVHRLFHVPDNPPRRDFPLPYALQVPWHRALVVFFLLALPLAFPGRAALVYVPFAMLCATYPLYHVFNKYAVPATPFLLLGAALALVRVGSQLNARLLAALLAAGVGAALPPSALAFLGVPPLVARWVLLGLHLLGLAAAFHAAAWSWTEDARARRLAALALLVLVLPTLAARVGGDPDWRRFERPLDQPAQHEVALRAEEIQKLNAAREAYLMLDLRIPSGDPKPLSLRFASGLVVPGAELQPTMPSFGIATTRFHRDPKSFRQWWRVAWRPEMAGGGGVQLTLQGSSGERLFGSLDDGAAVDHGLSLGQWPHTSVYRLMHDGEYRLAVGQPLGGVSRSSRYAGRELPGAWGVRIVALSEEASLARVETAPVPEARAIVTAFWARTSKEGPVVLETPAGSALFRLEERGASIRFGAGEARFVPTGEGEGWVLVRTKAEPRAPLQLTLRPLQQMVAPPRFFLPQLRAAPPIPLDWTGVPYVPVVKVLESRTLPWRPEAVF